MKQFIKKIAFYVLMSLLLFNGIAFLSLQILGKSNFYKPEFVKNTVIDTNFDYVVLGSSTGLTTLDTKLIDSITNKKGLNISMDDTSLNSHFLMLQHFKASNKSAKCLVLAVTPWDLKNKNPKLNNNDYRFLPYVQEDYVFDYYNELETKTFKPLSFSRYFPIIGVSYYNTEIFYPSIISFFNSNKRNHFDDKGNFCYPTNGKPNKLEIDEIEVVINNPFYFKIKEFCSQNNIKLRIYISPIFKTKLKIHDDSIIDQSNFLIDEEMFYDNIHVNQIGRRKCSIEFAKYLK
ncbi:hypothetical protein GOQ30_00770 [Flavobacterium sp. TP390]|uniref:Uncharacterized protein n=1 Tax=Flavobacterium profundi TaxID=1774945 RepID=A0A6I4II60_9FLAO|nr:hypothetical protein [Flavobacterium profundi]MVO07691.1 hypothetical protein [Flavobacterium profundi]